MYLIYISVYIFIVMSKTNYSRDTVNRKFSIIKSIDNNRSLIKFNRLLIETNGINQEKVWKI